MDFLEKDLEQIIWDDIQATKGEVLSHRGLEELYYSPHHTMRSFRQERIGNYGIADIIVATRYPTDGYIDIKIIEIKRGEINEKALHQVYRYKSGLSRYLRDVRGLDPETFKIYPILIGKELDSDGDWIHTIQELDDLSIYLYKYNIDGISFKWDSNNYVLIDEGF